MSRQGAVQTGPVANVLQKRWDGPQRSRLVRNHDLCGPQQARPRECPAAGGRDRRQLAARAQQARVDDGQLGRLFRACLLTGSREAPDVSQDVEVSHYYHIDKDHDAEDHVQSTEDDYSPFGTAN